MVETLQYLTFAETQIPPDITYPVKASRAGGLINRRILYKAIKACATYRGIQPDVAVGTNTFLQTKFLQEEFKLAQIVAFMVTLSELTDGINFYKSRSLNYLSESNDVGLVLDQTLENARFMTNLFGLDFFSRNCRFPERRKTFFRALIPDSDFYLTAKGGSGAGTFSVDLALAIAKGQDYTINTGEIWRTGFDTEHLPDGKRGVRIIRTGTAVKHDPLKTAQFEEFKRSFKTSPARALTFILLYYAQKLHPDRLIAITTQGARRLSSLRKSRHSYDYTHLFQEIGFAGQEDESWLELADLANPRKKERAGFERLTEALHNLRDADGRTLPLSETG